MEVAGEVASLRQSAAAAHADLLGLVADARQHNEQLAALNAELESFSDSVSNSLRAPVRAIGGYAQALAEDFGDRLDDQGRRLLTVVRDEASRMGGLIDDLLEFSRLGRVSLDMSSIDTDLLVRDVALKLNHDGAAVVEIGELPPVRGDRTLFRLVWEHLLANAIKYSGTRVAPVVRISGAIAGGEARFSIVDNGVGFDMLHADKLFGLFQRMHHADEFPGNGVGLATVNRVVNRHGGRVWAAGEAGLGARFHFAVPAGDE
jgi:light-regulated signal transduction histidine kinase (bacteriophytochrome)